MFYIIKDIMCYGQVKKFIYFLIIDMSDCITFYQDKHPD